MSGKFNNRLLLLVLIALATIFVITRFTKVKNANQTLKTELVQMDTSQVSTIRLYPSSEKGTELLFNRNGSSWSVTRGEIEAIANVTSVKRILGELQNLKARQLVTRSIQDQAQYQVGDSLGSRIVIMEGKKTSVDLIVGRFQYEPPQGGYDMYGQNRGTGKTYVRLNGEDEIYSVEGYLAMSINQPFNQWRDQSITRMNTSQLSRIVYDYPADTGFVAQHSDSGWMVAGQLADSLTMANYLNRLARLSHDEFADDFNPDSEPDYSVIFEGDNMKSQQLKGYHQSNGQIIVNSSSNPDSWFQINGSELFKDLFPGSLSLIEGSEK